MMVISKRKLEMMTGEDVVVLWMVGEGKAKLIGKGRSANPVYAGAFGEAFLWACPHHNILLICH